MGRPDLIPELTYTLEGVKPEIDEIIWYGGNVQHTLSADNGYTVSLELGSKLPEYMKTWLKRTRGISQGSLRTTATRRPGRRKR